MAPLRIALASAEVSPLAKTGGLGDVSAALARTLAAAGHDLRLFLPLYSTIDRFEGEVMPVEFLQGLELWMGPRRLGWRVWTTRLPGSDLWMYLVDCPELYRRGSIYTEDPDEAVRFAFFSRAVLECCQRMGWSPQIVHCNDWHTALLPLQRRELYGWDSLFAASRTLLTIHNIAYQGVFGRGSQEALGLAGQAGAFHQGSLEAGRINFLETGILWADRISTVSPTHADEIRTPELGWGLDALLRAHPEGVAGILNGIDTREWDPASDRHLRHHFDARDLAGKARLKAELLAELRLAPAPERPLLGMVSRLVEQKGIELLYDTLPRRIRERDLRLVVLGSGAARYEGFFEALQREQPDRVCFYRGFSEELAHRIEAAGDLFLMPSLYEPCGLSQMYSQRYGAVPLVRRTGGLADSVEPWEAESGRGTGFVFEHFTPDGFAGALDRALETWPDREAWRRLVANGMRRDFSWDRQAERYVDLYRSMLP